MQRIFAQQASPDKNTAPGNKRCFRLNDPPIKGKIYQIEIFLNALTASQSGRRTADELSIE
ncbi:MAG: hypothetical protein U1E51_14125 [Candidatus Binatia bacterium]|nr:hypothetical protein [Candidatus Binatia bacterium]